MSLLDTGVIAPSAIVNCAVPLAVKAIVPSALKYKPELVSPSLVNVGAPAAPSGIEITPVNAGLAKFALVATAVEMLLNSVSISVPLTILLASPDTKLSLVAKLVVLV